MYKKKNNILIIVSCVFLFIIIILIKVYIFNYDSDNSANIHNVNSNISYYQFDDETADVAYLNNDFYYVKEKESPTIFDEFSILCISGKYNIRNNHISDVKINSKRFDRNYVGCGIFKEFVVAQYDSDDGDFFDTSDFYDFEFNEIDSKKVESKYENYSFEEDSKRINKKYKDIFNYINKIENEKEIYYDRFEYVTELDNYLYLFDFVNRRLYRINSKIK